MLHYILTSLLPLCMDVVCCALFFVPVLALMRRHVLPAPGAKNTVLLLVFAAYITAVFSAVGVPVVTRLHLDVTVNLLPFTNGFLHSAESLLNVILFIPFGFLLPLLWPRFRSVGYTILSGFTFSVFIELSQLLTYRATDINDVLTNTLGTAVGCIISLLMLRIAGAKAIKTRHDGRSLLFVLVLLFGITFFIEPFLYSAVAPLVY